MAALPPYDINPYPPDPVLTFAQLAETLSSTLSDLPLPSIFPHLHPCFKAGYQKALIWSTIMAMMEETTAATVKRKGTDH